MTTEKLWLGEFLRSRRARLSPRDFGFPVEGRRRLLGLRRDEVAQLAGISIAYYSWIEQGRDVNMSSSVLRAIARTLKLNKAERLHLLTLVDVEADEPQGGSDLVHPSIAHLLCNDSFGFAAVYDATFNALQLTRLASELLDIQPSRTIESNMLYRLFAHPEPREIWVESETESRMAVGMFRQALARRKCPSDLTLLNTLRELPHFEQMWRAYDVRDQSAPHEFFREEPCQLRHPTVGIINVHRICMRIPASNDHTLVVYTPADAETNRKIVTLRKLIAPHMHRHLRPA